MGIRVGTNTVEAVLELYRSDLGKLYSAAEVRAITKATFQERLDLEVIGIDPRRTLSESELLKVLLPLKRLRKGEPLQYVLGEVEFHGLRLATDPRALIPRPETEELVDLIIRSQKATPATILDMCTGSGCIALALKKAFPHTRVIGTDISADALSLARINADRTGYSVEWILADALHGEWPLKEPLQGHTVVVSNPPYVPLSEEKDMAPSVLDHEPHLALFVSDLDPHQFHRAIATQAFSALNPGDELWFEGHYLHIPDTAEVVRQLGFSEVQWMKDLSGLPRSIRAIK